MYRLCCGVDSESNLVLSEQWIFMIMMVVVVVVVVVVVMVVVYRVTTVCPVK
jgi:hypothetical protein